MMTNSPFTTLERATDGVFDKVSAEESITSDPFIASLGIKTIPESEIPVSLEKEVFNGKAYPAIHEGDSYMYEFSDRNLGTGKVRFRRLGLGVKLTEEEFSQRQSSVYREIVEKELKMNNDYLKLNIQKYLANGGLAGAFIPLLAGSSAGTLSNPSDMCTSAATPEDLDAIIWSGNSQTVNNVSAFALAIKKLYKAKIDTNTLRGVDYKRITIYVPSQFYVILENGFDLLDSTNKARSAQNYIADLSGVSIDVVECPYVDSGYLGATTDPATCCAIADPKQNAYLLLGIPDGGAGWEEWKWIDQGNVRFVVKRKKAIFACQQTAYLINDSFYAAKIPFHTVPYNAT